MSVHAGDITNPQVTCSTRPGIDRVILVNRCNWRLMRRGGDPVNAAVHAAAGPCLEALCKQVIQEVWTMLLTILRFYDVACYCCVFMKILRERIVAH